MRYPNHKAYEALYSKYLDEASLKILMDLIGENLNGKRMFDICCGTGICTTEALYRNVNYVHMVDQEYDMIPSHFYKKDDKRIKVSNSPAEDLMVYLAEHGIKFDCAVSRQAVNYWFNEKSIDALAKIIKSGGVFAFNTFNTRPSSKPKIKQYYNQNISFTEISYVNFDDRVHHVQIREGYPPHVAEFAWISPEKFNDVLSRYFYVEKTTRNKTDYYKCVRR